MQITRLEVVQLVWSYTFIVPLLAGANEIVVGPFKTAKQVAKVRSILVSPRLCRKSLLDCGVGYFCSVLVGTREKEGVITSEPAIPRQTTQNNLGPLGATADSEAEHHCSSLWTASILTSIDTSSPTNATPVSNIALKLIP